jgi:AcrR family transcriptional regulator
MRVQVPRAEQVERNRRLVLDAARQVFLAKGYDGATLDAIAETAGFSKGVVYSQFANKADLFFALLEQRIDERAAQNERLVGRRRGAGAIEALLRHFERDARDDAGWARVLVEFRTRAMRDATLNRRYAQLHRRTVERLASLLERVRSAGDDVDDDGAVVSPEAMALFILAMGAGLALERSVDSRVLPVDELVAMTVRALGGSAT